MLKCKHCGAQLTAPAEQDHNEWVIRCLACNVINIIQQTVEIVGFRESK
jgi:hypothetical protein